MTGMNPFDWYGGAFLALYAFLLVGAFLGGFALASWLRPEGRAVPVTDDDELALLAGGPARLAESVVARLSCAARPQSATNLPSGAPSAKCTDHVCPFG